jgi:nitroreductase
MDVIEAIHTRRSIRSYLHQPVERELIEQVIWDAAQAPPPFSGELPWTFNVVQGIERISAYGNEALQYARDHHPDEAGWDWTARPDFKVFWGAPVLIVISGRVEDCCRAGQNLMLSAHASASHPEGEGGEWAALG